MSAEEPKAVVELVGDDLFSGHTPSGHLVMIDTDRERNSASSPMELLLVALGSCTGVDVVSILKKKREEVTAYSVEVRGQRRAEHPRSYRRMECITSSPVATFQSAQWLRQSNSPNKNTVASPQTLRPTAEIVSSFEIIEAGV